MFLLLPSGWCVPRQDFVELCTARLCHGILAPGHIDVHDAAIGCLAHRARVKCGVGTVNTCYTLFCKYGEYVVPLRVQCEHVSQTVP